MSDLPGPLHSWFNDGTAKVVLGCSRFSLAALTNQIELVINEPSEVNRSAEPVLEPPGGLLSLPFGPVALPMSFPNCIRVE